MKTKEKENSGNNVNERIVNPVTMKLEWIFSIVGIILVLFVLATIWCIPRSSGDLFISLAAGRDIMSGRLTTPDDWSFSTDGRVWLNQNWGADVILYLCYNFFGETGLLALKFLLLLTCAFFLTMALRKIKIPLSISILITAIIMVSINFYTILRPNLFTLVFVPLLLWLLYKTINRPFIIWIAVIVTVVWTNIHASFIFGLGMICIWVICAIIPDLLQRKWDALIKKWQLVAGSLVAILLSGLCNPFGFTNLTFPFQMLQNDVWQTIKDWRPIWETEVLSHYVSTILTFVIVTACTLLLLVINLAFVLYKRLRSKADKSTYNRLVDYTGDLHVVIFEIICAVVAVIMAVRANRFITLALIALAPILARQIAWIVRTIRISWLCVLPLAVLNCIVLAYSLILMVDNVRNYDANNPIMNTGEGSLFEKMHYTNTSYDAQLVKFIKTSQLGGNIFSPWEWEGYLRWNCPFLRMFIGGRAQQVYDAKTFYQFLYISGVDVPPYSGQAPEDVLDSIVPHLFIVGNSANDDDTILTVLNCGNWAIVYSDTRYILFADMNWPATDALVRRMTVDQVSFETPSTTSLSRASYILTTLKKWDAKKIMDLFTEAFELEPTWLWGYKMLFETFQNEPKLYREIAALLDNRLEFLSGMSIDGPDAESVLHCRIYITDALQKYASSLGLEDKAALEYKLNSLAKDEYLELQKKWNFIISR